MCFCLVMRVLIDFKFVLHARACCFFVVWRVPRILVSTLLSVGFPYFTNVVQLLCSLSGRLHLYYSSIRVKDLKEPKAVVELDAN